MKKESIKVLQDLSANCGQLSANEIRKEIERVFFIETPKAAGSFRLESICTKHDKVRGDYFTDGIMYKYGYKMATDLTELYAIEEGYDEEGAIITKDGRNIAGTCGRCPDWRNIIPKKEATANYREFSADLEAAMNFQKEVKAKAKTQTSDDPEWIEANKAMVKFGDIYFRLDRWINFAKFMAAYGIQTFIADKRRAACAGSLEEGHVGLLMPLTTPYDFGPVLEMAV